jgi:mannose-6-phosphate isomerase-like protein (cupin superfamily)
MDKANPADLERFTTADGSSIRELAGPAWTSAPPGIPHKLWNTGTTPRVLLCCCAPAYSHDDTVMTGG